MTVPERAGSLPALAVLLVAALSASALAHGAPATLTPDQAKDHVGDYATVQGRVFGVHTSNSGTTFLNFGAPYPRNTFSAVVFASDAGRFGNLARLGGATVQVSGVIRLYRDKPEIVLNAPAQLRVVRDAPR
jgi:hypothetical protein